LEHNRRKPDFQPWKTAPEALKTRKIPAAPVRGHRETAMKTVLLENSDLRVPLIGLGCMGMTPIYSPPSEADNLRAIDAAIETGANFLDTSDAYADGRNEEFLARALRGRRDKVILATKFGNIRHPDGSRAVNGRPEYVAQAADACLARLGTGVIDLFYQHRVDPDTPIEETVGAMSRLIEAGKVRAIGLSEAGPDTIRRAHAMHPIAALQTEYSLWSRFPEAEILPVCRERAIAFVAYAPLGRGFLTGRFASPDDLDARDRRRDMPRYAPENFAHNLALVGALKDIAQARAISPAQVALAWLAAQGVVSIPGGHRPEHVRENAAAADIALDAAEVARLSAAFPDGAARGTRYPAGQLKALGI
jgi:aryl-alcohol dehydrogenase-like predicted oxidoreductase